MQEVFLRVLPSCETWIGSPRASWNSPENERNAVYFVRLIGEPGANTAERDSDAIAVKYGGR